MNLENLSFQELIELKSKIQDKIDQKKIIIPNTTLIVLCQNCGKHTTRISCDVDNWWNIIFHCDHCGKHSKIEASHTGNLAWIKLKKYEKYDNLTETLTKNKSQDCVNCGASALN